MTKAKGFANGQKPSYRYAGKGPAFCPVCGKRGGVIDTRIHTGWIRRRRKCLWTKTHPRWSTLELNVERKAGEMLRVANVLKTLNVNELLDTIGRLRSALRRPGVKSAVELESP